MKKCIFVDMDGVIAKWQPDKTIEEVAMKGYFKTVPVVHNMIIAIKNLIASGLADVYILSSVFNDEHSQNDKRFWLNEYLPEIRKDNIIFVPYGEKKSKYVSVNNNTYLLDDLSKNLHEWEAAGGIGIKTYNGINGNYGTWKGFSVHSSMTPDRLYRQLLGIVII